MVLSLTKRYGLVLVVVLGSVGSLPAAPAPREASEANRVPEFIKALQDKDPLVRKQVAAALGELSGRARAAVPALREALLDSDANVRLAAATALERIAGADGKADGDKLEPVRRELEAALRQERARLEQALAELEARKAELAQAARDRDRFRQLAAAHEIEAKTLKERSARLEQELQRLTQQLNRENRDAPAKPPAGNPPPRNLRGVIKRVEPGSGLLVISLGLDAGLQKGHTLEVFRLKPRPAYLGMIRILDVRATEAVAEAVRKGPMTIEPGDEVASQIAPGG